ncbi:MAG: peptidoglycan-binding protein [Coriobacteriia bacterium]|nr:peptidoglycan-binding protein [Coriobacteriia bacterium]
MDTETITTLQTALVTLGFRCPVTGVIDEATQAAIKDFQSNVLLAVTGLPDEATMAAIKLLDNAWEGKDLPQDDFKDSW